MRIGLDIGSVSLKLAVVGDGQEKADITRLCEKNEHFRLVCMSAESGDETVLALSESLRINRSPTVMVRELLAEIYALIPEGDIAGLSITGANCQAVAEQLGLDVENEGKATSLAVSSFYPSVRTIFEIGGRAFNFITLGGEEEGPRRRKKRRKGTGQCEEGIGYFLDQQADRMGLAVSEMGESASRATQAPRISRGCSVFIKSDMIHSQQKGYSPEEVLRALCESVAIKFKNNAVKGQDIVAPVALIGGVSQNKGVVKALLDTFELKPEDLFVPELYGWFGAIGATMMSGRGHKEHGRDHHRGERPGDDGRKKKGKGRKVMAKLPPLSLDNVTFLDDAMTSSTELEGDGRISAFLGIDIGSVSTKFAVIDEEGKMVHTIYRPTAGRPVEAVAEGMEEIRRLWQDRLDIKGVGTTGSGRELIAEIIGADAINDEITAHKTGAVHISEVLGIPAPDTIFEIGGQDSKYIYIEEGTVTDFAMNEACAAGTGSFLAEQAETLKIDLRKEFAKMAFSAEAPVHLGEFCTVVIAEDMIMQMHEGEPVPNLLAGLALAVARNYINLVVRRRPIGEVVYFQGGTASNQAVAAAFGEILGRKVIVPPYNGIIGAMGAAVLARDWIADADVKTKFRGLAPQTQSIRSRNFTCKGCNNFCDVKEMLVDGKKSYWGNRCADRYGSPVLSNRVPVIPDLITYRQELFDEIAGGGLQGGRLRIGLPQALTHFDLYPFWHRYLTELGMEVHLSPDSDPKIIENGQEIVESQFCFPINVAFGHVKALVESDVDYILLPAVVSADDEDGGGAQSCMWMRLLPHFMKTTPNLVSSASKFLIPTISFRKGMETIKEELAEVMGPLGVAREESDRAVEKAYEAQRQFREKLVAAGRAALKVLQETGEQGIVLVGRSYTIYDRNVNCDTPRKLRARYGANVIPFDFLPTEDIINVSGVGLPWESGEKIEIASSLSASMDNLHMIYNCSFPCGPDAEIKPVARRVSDKPVLFLQFDGNGYDAGYMTRCEAYLASKGILQSVPKDGDREEEK